MENFIEYLPGLIILIVYPAYYLVKKKMSDVYGKRIFSVSALMVISFLLGEMSNTFFEQFESSTLLIQILTVGFFAMIFAAILKNAKIAIGTRT